MELGAVLRISIGFIDFYRFHLETLNDISVYRWLAGYAT
jgi:hypothetical protein